MKKLFALGSALITLPFAAHAADLYSPPPAATFTPAVYSGFNWTGFYLGGNAGYLWGESSLSGGLASTATFDRDGFIGGAQIGYNYQTGPWVLGVEADIQYSDSSGTSTSGVCAGSCSADLNWFGTVRARGGYAFDQWLFYATGGWAYGDVDTSVTGLSSTSETLTGGWAVGGGVEYGFAGNWTARAEYLYMDLGSSDGFVSGDFDDNHIFRLGVNYLFN